jgi:hypothetical protein
VKNPYKAPSEETPGGTGGFPQEGRHVRGLRHASLAIAFVEGILSWGNPQTPGAGFALPPLLPSNEQ